MDDGCLYRTQHCIEEPPGRRATQAFPGFANQGILAVWPDIVVNYFRCVSANACSYMCAFATYLGSVKWSVCYEIYVACSMGLGRWGRWLPKVGTLMVD